MVQSQRTLAARLVCGVILLAMGAVPLIMNGQYLFGGDWDDVLSAVLSVVTGLVAVGVGIYLLAGPRSHGKARVLTDAGSRRTFAGMMFALCTILLIGSLFVEHPSVSTGIPGLVLTNSFLQLFVSGDSGNE